MIKSKEEKILIDRQNGLSIRSLALKYGLSPSRVFRLVKSKKIDPRKALQSGEEMPDDVAELKALLRRERLKNELLNNIIDIADKELALTSEKSLAPGSRNRHGNTLAGIAGVMQAAWL